MYVSSVDCAFVYVESKDVANVLIQSLDQNFTFEDVRISFPFFILSRCVLRLTLLLQTRRDETEELVEKIRMYTMENPLHHQRKRQ